MLLRAVYVVIADVPGNDISGHHDFYGVSPDQTK
ncbi:Uncharacterised protein [Salmonella enterica subsp. diarizonae]|uniref:Uncharacterized protein n=1 Tax=Salmonella diarizonae TaxID=59204 RepID=A0A379U1N0_SALDZ|nr:Uncharacterised protein [Salmonella enterica subsp. diarizonae]